MPELETVDLEGVEILAAGGPVFGIGSPPEGDFWTEDDLRAMAAAANELADELKPPNKIGHSDGQQLLLNSGLGDPTSGEMPAVGWLDGTTFRVEAADGDEPAKLLADIKAIPKTAAALFESGAWRTRSVELSKVTSQKTGKVYEWVVTGLAWLGAKLPAVRTLDDIVALYEGDGIELRRVFAKGDVIWSPTDGYESLRYRVSEALNGETAGVNESRFWVRDVAADRALVEDWYDTGGPQTAWIVPFTSDSEGDVTVADRDLWTPAELAWLEAAKSYSDDSQRRSDTRPPMAEVKYTDEHRRKFAEATGLEQDKVTDEMLTAAGVVAEAPKEEPKVDEPVQVKLEDEAMRKLEETAKSADDRSRKLEEDLRLERRRNFIEQAMKDGRIEPGQRAEYERSYDLDPANAEKLVAALSVNEDLVRQFGNEDGDEATVEAKRELEEKDYAGYAATHLGIDEKELI